MDVGLNLTRVTAREVSRFNQDIKANPDAGIDNFAEFMAKVIVSIVDRDGKAMVEPEKLADPEFYLELPFWPDPENEDSLSFNDCVDALNSGLSAVPKTMKKK